MQSLDFTEKLLVAPTSSTEVGASTSLESDSEFRTACGFRFWIKAQRKSIDLLEIYLESEPESFCADSYQLLIDYQLTLLELGDGNEIDKRACAGISVNFEPIAKGYSERSDDERWILRVGWDEALNGRCLKVVDETAQEPVYCCVVCCNLRIRELLPMHRVDYSQESLPRRDFALLIGHQKQFYVDLQYLADQGSDYFRDLLESKRKGVRRAVVMVNASVSDMETFLDAVCTHRKPIITNRNFDVVLRVAQEFGVDKVLRACEAYLIETDAVHVVRKLEYAAEFGLGLLGETVVRRLTNERPMAALTALHEYLQMNDERLDQMHPDVLCSLNVFGDYVVL